MPRAVQFDVYGDVDVLHLAEVEKPEPADGEILVRVRAAGINPGEVAIRSGAMDKFSPAHFPEGEGTDLAGVVDAVGPDVDGVQPGAEVIGWSDRRGAQADYAVLPAANVVPKPPQLAWDQAAVCPVSCATAASIIEALGPQPDETVVVAGASGGVGVVVCQLARRAGAHVVGTASERNLAYLRTLGVDPVTYGDGVEDRIRAAAAGGIDAFADCHGDGNVDLAVALGVAPVRINTIIDFGAAQRVGAKAQGMYQLDDIGGALAPVVDLLAAGQVALPIKARFPLDHVQDAYQRLSQAGGVGKIVLEISTDE